LRYDENAIAHLNLYKIRIQAENFNKTFQPTKGG